MIPPILAECAVGVKEKLALCTRVLSKSNGWNNKVEHVPLSEPARNDLSIGCWEQKTIVYFLIPSTIEVIDYLIQSLH